MHFRASFCDPFKADIIELGPIDNNKLVEKFESIPWRDYLLKMELATESEIHFSPSLEIENIDTKNGLSISAVGNPNKIEFYIFYKRPKKVRMLFGLIKSTNKEYMTDIQGQTKQDVINCLNALLKNETKYLANKIGE